jgi:hypothetical protein
MTDPKKNPNKQRRSFFWRRKPLRWNWSQQTRERVEEDQARRNRGIARRC